MAEQPTSSKRKLADSDAISRKAFRRREELVGSDEEVRHLSAIDDNDESTINRAGEYAHIKSAKRRHKLEKEARKARKAAQNEHNLRGDSDQLRQDEIIRHTSTDQASAGVHMDGPSIRPKKRLKIRKEAQEDAQEADQEEARRLKKHATVFKKLDQAQKRAKAIQAKASMPTEAQIEPSESQTVLVDPLLPIKIVTSVPEVTVRYSALPSWMTSARRFTSTASFSFKDLHLNDATVDRLAKIGYKSALPVQQALIPLLLPPGSSGAYFASGQEVLIPDVAVSAPTGSGKTLAYLIPIIQALRQVPAAEHTLRALIVVPTRELVTQVSATADSLVQSSGIKIGSASGAGKLRDEQQKLTTTAELYDPEEYLRLFKLAQLVDYPPPEESLAFAQYIAAVEEMTDATARKLADLVDYPIDFVRRYTSAVDIVICTPGRLMEHLDHTPGFDISNVRWLVLDEADKLLDEQYDGFLERLQRELHTPRIPEQQSAREIILRKLNMWHEHEEHRVRKIVLSATMTQHVSQLSALRLRRPQLIIIGAENHAMTDEPSAGTYEVPRSLKEYCVPVGDGSRKPLQLVQLLSSRVLSPVTTGAETLGLGHNDDSDDASSVLTTSSDPGSDSESSITSADSSPSETVSVLQSSIRAPTVLVFAASNEAASRLTHLLRELRPQHAEHIFCLTKSTSSLSLKNKSKSTDACIIVSTDRAGRGLDTVAGRHITHVIQYDVPRSLVSYVHRVGRTARAGRAGAAWTLYSRSEARWFVNDIVKSSTIQRAAPVETIKLDMESEADVAMYEAALTSMKDMVKGNR